MNFFFYLLIVVFSIGFSQRDLIDRYHTYADIVDSLMIREQKFSNNDLTF